MPAGGAKSGRYRAGATVLAGIDAGVGPQGVRAVDICSLGVLYLTSSHLDFILWPAVRFCCPNGGFDMALIRWEPVRELSTMQNEMNRLFGTFFDSPTPRSGRRALVRSWIPAMDVVENENEYVLRADLPGLSEGDVNVELDDNVLRISGERKSEHEEKTDGFY